MYGLFPTHLRGANKKINKKILKKSFLLIFLLAPMNVQWQLSERGNMSLFINFFKFRVNRRTDTRIYWKCSTEGCLVKAVTENEDLIAYSNNFQHDHVLMQIFSSGTN
jgi:hypothetical protein